MERLAIVMKTADGRVFTHANIKKPTAEIIAQTVEAIRDKNEFTAIKKFVQGCIDSFIEDNGNEETNIIPLSRDLAYKAVELLSLQIMLKYNPKDGIEGVYSCPHCGKKIYARQSTEDDDTRDFIKDMAINYCDEPVYNFDLVEPVTIKIGQEMTTVSSIKARQPLIEDYEKSYHFINTPIRMQWSVNTRCILEINNLSVDDAWKKKFGQELFQRITDINDANYMQREVNKYGLDTNVEKFCNECGVSFKVRVNTANFFGSGLE